MEYTKLLVGRKQFTLEGSTSKPEYKFSSTELQGFRMHKACSKCGQVKSASEFHKNRTKPSGLSYRCKTCKSSQDRERNQNADREAAGIKDRARRSRLKRELIEAYRGACACCGESTFEFLSVDHIFNDGRQHLTAIGGGKRSSKLYGWLKRHGFPKDRYQLLCMNCNFAKGRYGACPHRKGN